MRILSIACMAVLVACTSAASLTKPKEDQYFVLEKDYVRTQVRGVVNNKWVEGLRAGKYTAIGEDDDGIYFAGEGDCVIVLVQETAERYLQTGYIAPLAQRPVLSGGHGGLWLPKPGVDREPRLFYEIRNTNEVRTSLVGIATEKAFNYVSYGSEKVFVSGLRVMKVK